MAAPAASQAPVGPSRAAAPAGSTPQPSRRPGSRADPRRRPELRVVGAPRRARRWLVVMLVTGLLGVGGITSLSAASAEAAFTARELNEEITRLEQTRDELSSDVAELSSLRRIRTIATQELGMVPAEDPRYLRADAVHQVPASHSGQQPADPVKAARSGQW